MKVNGSSLTEGELDEAGNRKSNRMSPWRRAEETGKSSWEETSVDRETGASSNMTGGKEEQLGVCEGGLVGLQVRGGWSLVTWFYFLCKNVR